MTERLSAGQSTAAHFAITLFVHSCAFSAFTVILLSADQRLSAHAKEFDYMALFFTLQ